MSKKPQRTDWKKKAELYMVEYDKNLAEIRQLNATIVGLKTYGEVRDAEIGKLRDQLGPAGQLVDATRKVAEVCRDLAECRNRWSVAHAALTCCCKDLEAVLGVCYKAGLS